MRALGFRGLGFRGLIGIRVQGFRFQGLGAEVIRACRDWDLRFEGLRV